MRNYEDGNIQIKTKSTFGSVELLLKISEPCFFGTKWGMKAKEKQLKL